MYKRQVKQGTSSGEVEVIKSLKEDPSLVSHQDLNEYIDKHIIGMVHLPIYYKLQIRRLLSSPNLNLRSVVSLVSNVTGCAAFVLDDNQNLVVSGKSKLLDYEIFEEIEVFRNVLNLLESPKDILNIIESNFSLFPLLVAPDIEIQGNKLESVVLISTRLSLKAKNYIFGIIGPINLNYELVVPLIIYINQKE
jgi:transcriptional regulator of heat shock response